MTFNLRSAALQAFITQHATTYHLDPASITPASADASFRQYFRVLTTPANHLSRSYIVMDAPPEHENCQPFIHVAHLFKQAHVTVPHVLEQNIKEGFLLLTDLGDTTYLKALQSGQDHRPLYADAIQALVKLQAASLGSTAQSMLLQYDATKLQQEMALFETWFLNKHHGIVLNAREAALLQVALHLITQACIDQPKVWVHRDFHCRNLMALTLMPPTNQNNFNKHLNVNINVINNLNNINNINNINNLNLDNVGVLDFQDAVTGAYTYDLASLLRDAYIDWPEEAQIELAIAYWQAAKAAGIPIPDDFGQVWRDFEWMSLQRHLKILGIFARLYHRDGKAGYLNDLPLVLQYAQRTAQRYDGLGILVRLFDTVQGIQRPVGITF